MRLWILSDLHARGGHKRFPDPPPDVDVIVVAGDTTQGAMLAADYLRELRGASFAGVVTVLGNHEFYSSSIEKERRIAREIDGDDDVNFLDDAWMYIDGVRFIGATLWTDYALYADGSETWRQQYMKAASLGLNDHRAIRVLDDADRRFTPADALALHEVSRAFLEAELAKPQDGPTIVVSHHCPHPNSVPALFAGDKLTPAFCSDLSATIERYQPALWIHGHTHSSFDYIVGKTRVVCNPHGYGDENPEFRWDLVLEV